MIKNINYIINYSEGILSKRKMQKFESDLHINSELQQDYAIYSRINEYMRGKSDLEEVRNDPALPVIDLLVKESIKNFHQDPENIKNSQKFIRDALNEKLSDTVLKEEINQIKREVEELNLNEISEGWVKEWIENNQEKTVKDPRTEKIRDFINQSLEAEKYSSVLKIVHTGKSLWRKSVTLRVIGLAAAVLIAGVVLIKTLIPSDNSEKLYYAFYKPMSTISPITRGFNSSLSKQYDLAIKMYNQGNYNFAAPMFNDIIQQDNSNIAPHFFQGITQMELGNYSKAISYLSFVTSHPQEYIKEAQWYLALSYLKTGEKTKAIPYFKILSESEGFYQDQAKKLLRRLK